VKSLGRVVRRLLADQRVKFLLVGGFNTVAGYGAYALFYWLGGSSLGALGPLVCLLAAHLVVSTFAFYLYRRLVFGVSGSIVRDYLRFQSVYAVSLALNGVLLWVTTGVLHWNAYAAQALVVTLITIGSYFGHRYFSFRRRADALGTPRSDSGSGETS
jgi:putative flippase GtrA